MIELVCIGMVLVVMLVVYTAARQPVLMRLTKAEREIFQQRKLIEELTDSLRESNDSRVEFENATRRAVASEFAVANFTARDWERRAKEYEGVIAGVLKERDEWNRLYDEQSIGHGNAQAVMMDAISFLERENKKAGSTVELHPVIRETQKLYYERHVAPALERTGGAIVPPRSSQGQTMSAQDPK